MYVIEITEGTGHGPASRPYAFSPGGIAAIEHALAATQEQYRYNTTDAGVCIYHLLNSSYQAAKQDWDRDLVFWMRCVNDEWVIEKSTPELLTVFQQKVAAQVSAP